MANKYFTVKTDAKSGKQIITIDTTVIPTQAEKDVAQMYIATGAIQRFKSEKRAKNARERAKKNGFGKKKAEAEAK